MCQQCLNNVRKFYPDLSIDQAGDLLWSATGFPYSSPKQLKAELIELKKNTDGTVEGAKVYAHQKMSRQLEILNKTDSNNYDDPT